MFKNLRQSLSNHTGAVAAAIGSAATFSFFLLAYPYHLMRREQMNLFLFDTDFIRQTYHGSGWMARFVCDFLDQFFGLPVVGPLVITLLLVAIGAVTYRICRKVLGKWPSLATGEVRALESIKGDKSDTYHSWSSSSRWFVFVSKRGDGQYGKPYFCHLDTDGNPTKPFVLSQKSSRFYDYNFRSFNIPDLARASTGMTPADARHMFKAASEPFKNAD